MRKITETSPESKATLAECKRLMALRREPGQQILAELRQFKAERRQNRRAA